MSIYNTILVANDKVEYEHFWAKYAIALIKHMQTNAERRALYQKALTLVNENNDIVDAVDMVDCELLHYFDLNYRRKIK